MYCEACGMENPNDMYYCESCGSPLGQPSSAQGGRYSKQTVATAVLAVFISIAIVVLAAILYHQGTTHVSKSSSASAEKEVQTSGKGSSTSSSSSTSAKIGNATSTLDDTVVVIVQNFIGAVYGGDWESLDSEDIVQLQPLVEQSVSALRDDPDVADALDTVEQVLGTAPIDATFDIVGEPEITSIGDNGVSVKVKLKMHDDDSGSLTYEDVWNLLLSESGTITDATVSRTQVDA